MCLQYTQIWKLFFQKSLSDVQLDKPLSMKILENTSHKITKFLLFLHSQETFLNYDLKIASREKDESKIISLGPYALALSYILAKAKSKKSLEAKFVYRGIKMFRKDFDEQFGEEEYGIINRTDFSLKQYETNSLLEIKK